MSDKKKTDDVKVEALSDDDLDSVAGGRGLVFEIENTGSGTCVSNPDCSNTGSGTCM